MPIVRTDGLNKRGGGGVNFFIKERQSNNPKGSDIRILTG